MPIHVPEEPIPIEHTNPTHDRPRGTTNYNHYVYDGEVLRREAAVIAYEQLATAGLVRPFSQAARQHNQVIRRRAGGQQQVDARTINTVQPRSFQYIDDGVILRRVYN